MTTDRSPAQCTTMAELRAEIDAIDGALIDLLARRASYIDRAVDLKRIENLPARTTDRVAQVVQNVRLLAGARGLDPDLAETLWSVLIEWSIARETEHLGP